MQIVAEMWSRVQGSLFPHLRSCLDDPLTAKLEQLVRIWEVVRIEEHVPSAYQHVRGRRPHDRRWMARAFVAKAVYNLADTKSLLDLLQVHASLRRLCGWEARRDIPSEATFSRAFAEFARSDLGDRVHAALVAQHVGEQVVMHVSRDATAVEARQRPAKKKRMVGPPKNPERVRKALVRKRDRIPYLKNQLEQTAEQSLAELPRLCDVGAKINAKGKKYSWVGWKAHIDWADGGIPLTVVTTSASMNDCRAAIPMMRLTAQKVRSLYDLMDSGYDYPAIHAVSEGLGHVPIIAINRGTNRLATELDPAQTVRLRVRETAERGNSRLKDEFGLRMLRVRGHAKAHLHIMFGVLALFADQLMKPYIGGG